jgi:DNA-binding beta-propeller fold protein YncE
MQKSIVLAVVLVLAAVVTGMTYSQQVANRTEVGDVVMFSDVSADGKVVVFSGQCFTCPEDYFHMVIYNTVDGTAEKIDDIGPNPWGISISSDGKKAYVASVGEGGECPCSIGVYDLERKVKSKIEVGGKVPQGIRVSPDGTMVYYTDASRGGGLRGINTATGQEIYEFLIPGYLSLLVNLSTDGRIGYLTGIVSGNETTVKVVDLAGKKELATISTGLNTRGEIHGASVSKDGKTMVVTESSRSGSKAVIIDLVTSKVQSTVEVGGYPQEVAISPDGRTAYVANLGSKSISVIDIDSGKTKFPNFDLENCDVFGFQVSPDSKEGYCGCMKLGQIWRLKF